MAKIGELLVKLKADTTDYENGMNKAKATSGTFKAVISQNLSQIGQQMASTGKQILSSLGQLITTSADYSAEVEQQKFVFDKLDPSVQKAISGNTRLATSLGMTKQQYLNGATSISSFLSRMGMSNQSISEQSSKITTLTADMAAMANVPVTQAIDDFKSALAGNWEALDKYEMTVSESTINQSEYAQSLGKTWRQMNQTEKAQAQLSTMFEQGADFTGLAAQESGNFSSKMNKLKENIRTTASAIGEKLFPVLEPLIQTISEIAQNIANWANEHPKLTQGILLVIGVIGGLMAVGGPLLTLFSSLSIVALALNIEMLPLIGTIAGITAVIVAVVGAGVLLYQNWDVIKAKASEIWNNVTTDVGDAMQKIADWFNKCISDASKWVSDMWNKAKEAGSKYLSSIGTFFSQLPGKVWGYLSATIAKAVKFATDFANKGKQAATEFGSKIVSGLKSIPSKVVSIGRNIVQGLWNGISGAAGWLYSKVTSFASGIVNKMKAALGINSPSRIMRDMVGKFIPEGIAVGIDANADSVYNSLDDLANTSVGISTDKFRGVVANNNNSNLNNSSTNNNAIVEELRSLHKLIENIEIILNVDSREFTRTAIAPNKRELDNYNTRKVKFAY